ncbi:MAG: hypothetical protein M3T56_10235 [Chloroflexota bacterium]|nr:hypothetical protein [Chloroflexota bacterium]
MRTQDTDTGITSLQDERVRRAIEAALAAPREPAIPYGEGMTPGARELVDEMIEDATAIALDLDKDAADALARFADRIAGRDSNERAALLAAFVAGARAGTVAVARQWVKKSPATLMAFWALRGRSPDAKEVEAAKKERDS